VFAPPGPPKPAEALASYAANGSGTVQGARDRDKEIQIEFWQRAAKEGFSDERACASAQKFRTEFNALNQRLMQLPYLMARASACSTSPGSSTRIGCRSPAIH